MLLTSATKLVEPEEVVRLTQADLNRLEVMAKKRAAREKKMKDSFDVNVVCVRSVTEKRRMRSKVHEVCTLLLNSLTPIIESSPCAAGVHNPHSSTGSTRRLRFPTIRRFQDACGRAS